jgi:HK97 gp10 family phage protein
MPSNIGSVINDIDDVQDDLRRYLRRHVARAMRLLQADARTYIERDADWKGTLASSLSMDVERDGAGARIVVSAGGQQAPHAPFVEFGTGSRTEQTSGKAPSSGIIYEPASYPADFPYKSPSMSPGMVANIISWVETKPIAPGSDISDEELGFRIASAIANKGTYAHPFMRPAWFHNELRVRQSAQNALRKATR